MARLFITPREIDLISDITKEVIKDVVGQKIYYYPISDIKSKIHEVYQESPEKVFDNPIEINCLVEYQETEVTTGKFGNEQYYNISAFVQNRDLIDKGIQLYVGDFFSYGTVFFEVIQLIVLDNIYGQAEYTAGIKLVGKEARKSQFVSKLFGPTDESYSDADATQKTFVQQRGFAENSEGVTGDKRALIEQGKTQLPPDPAPAEVSPRGADNDGTSAFYDES
jgi:hypothetical protein